MADLYHFYMHTRPSSCNHDNNCILTWPANQVSERVGKRMLIGQLAISMSGWDFINGIFISLKNTKLYMHADFIQVNIRWTRGIFYSLSVKHKVKHKIYFSFTCRPLLSMYLLFMIRGILPLFTKDWMNLK